MKKSGCARRMRLEHPQSAPLEIDAPALADSVGRPGEAEIAALAKAPTRKLPDGRQADVARIGQILEPDAVEDPLAAAAGRQVDARGVTRVSRATGPGARRHVLKRSVVDHSTSMRDGPVGAAPDDGAVPRDVAGGRAVRNCGSTRIPAEAQQGQMRMPLLRVSSSRESGVCDARLTSSSYSLSSLWRPTGRLPVCPAY